MEDVTSSEAIKEQIQKYLVDVSTLLEKVLGMTASDKERFIGMCNNRWVDGFWFKDEKGMTYILDYRSDIGIHLQGTRYSEFLTSVNNSLERLYREAF